MRENVPAADALIDKYFPVLDHGFVALKDYIGGDKSVETFARTSYLIGEEERTPEQTRNLIRYLMRMRHSSPFESSEIVVHIGLPIFVARQLIRSRTASLNEYSGRYSEVPTIFYEPDNDRVCFQSGSNKQGSDQPVDVNTFAEFIVGNQINRRAVSDAYHWSLEQGVARETARMDLPLSTYTYMYWKMDLHNLMHFISLRSDSHAQWEIQQYSDVLAGLMKAVAPICFEAFMDYKFGAVTFSRMEMQVLRNAIHDYERGEPDGFSDFYKIEALKHTGIEGKREQDEFLAKLKAKPCKSFDLDLESAKDGRHFFDKAKANL